MKSQSGVYWNNVASKEFHTFELLPYHVHRAMELEQTVCVKRLRETFSVEVVKTAVLFGVQKLGYGEPTDEQKLILQAFLAGKAFFACLPTGSGKSLCYAALPSAFEYLRSKSKENRLQGQIPSSCIVVVVSPLTALMVDQVAMFKNRGLQAAFVGKEQIDERIRQQVEKGVFSLVFMSPESLLKVLRWREMFRSKIYQDNLVGLIVDEAHCVEKW